jgi:hypothetical protein
MAGCDDDVLQAGLVCERLDVPEGRVEDLALFVGKTVDCKNVASSQWRYGWSASQRPLGLQCLCTRMIEMVAPPRPRPLLAAITGGHCPQVSGPLARAANGAPNLVQFKPGMKPGAVGAKEDLVRPCAFDRLDDVIELALTLLGA